MRLDRINTMEQYILKKGTVSLEELTQVFKVSINTIRRDVASLLDRGNIKKVYGGVCAIGNNRSTSSPIWVRNMENNAAKQAIARLASNLVGNNFSVFVDSGSTTEKVIPYLAEKENIILATYFLPAMCEASKYPSITMMGLGGVYNANTASFVGVSTTRSLEDMHFDIILLSTTSIMRNDLSINNYLESEIKQAVISQNKGKKIVLMADHSKFERVAAFRYGAITDLSALVTDKEPSQSMLELLQQEGVECIYPEEE